MCVYTTTMHSASASLLSTHTRTHTVCPSFGAKDQHIINQQSWHAHKPAHVNTQRETSSPKQLVLLLCSSTAPPLLLSPCLLWNICDKRWWLPPFGSWWRRQLEPAATRRHGPSRGSQCWLASQLAHLRPRALHELRFREIQQELCAKPAWFFSHFDDETH